MILLNKIIVFTENNPKKQIKVLRQLTEEVLAIRNKRKYSLPEIEQLTQEIAEITDNKVLFKALEFMEAIFRNTHTSPRVEDLKKDFVVMLKNKIAQPGIDKKVIKQANELMRQIKYLHSFSFSGL